MLAGVLLEKQAEGRRDAKFSPWILYFSSQGYVLPMLDSREIGL
jgi:hypothetical protein